MNTLAIRTMFILSMSLMTLTVLFGQQASPTLTPGDFLMKDFKFESGETLPELKLHYVTLGTPQKDKNGQVTNAVIINHGTGGSYTQFIGRGFGGVLFLKG